MFDIMYFYAISVQQEYLGLPIGWRTNKAVYKFNYKHKLCEDGNFVLVCVPLGTSIIINGKKSLIMVWANNKFMKKFFNELLNVDFANNCSNFKL